MLHRLIDFAFPARCASCTRIGNGLCDSCAPRSSPLERRLDTLDVRALGEYAGAYGAAVRALKDGRRDVAESLGIRLAELVPPDAILVAVPTTSARKRVRGIDGVETVASIAASAAGASSLELLECIGRRRQRGLNRAERLRSQNRFICGSELVTGCTVTLVDDVCTTGTTLEDCARALRAAGARVSEAIVVAIAFQEPQTVP